MSKDSNSTANIIYGIIALVIFIGIVIFIIWIKAKYPSPHYGPPPPPMFPGGPGFHLSF